MGCGTGGLRRRSLIKEFVAGEGEEVGIGIVGRGKEGGVTLGIEEGRIEGRGGGRGVTTTAGG